MGNVIAFKPPADLPTLSVHDLIAQALQQNAALTRRFIDLTKHCAEHERTIAALQTELGELRERVPPPKSAVPHGWYVVKEAEHRSGIPASTLYRRYRRRLITGDMINGAEIDGMLYLDIATIASRA
jgi:hypothetical protein